MMIDSGSEGSLKELSTLVEVENVVLQQQQKCIKSRRKYSISMTNPLNSPSSKQLHALQLQTDIKIEKARCQKILTQRDLLIVMQSGMSHEVHLAESLEPQYMRLVVKGMKSPVKLRLEYIDLTKNSSHMLQEFDLKIYLSYRNKKPSPSSFDKKFVTKPKTITISSLNENGSILSNFNQD